MKFMHILAAALLLTTSPVPAQWEKLPPLPETNGGFSCGADESGILVIGGTNWAGGTKNWLQTISRFDTKSMRWEVVSRLTEPLAYAVCGARQRDGRLVILGGSSGKAPARSIVVVDKGKPRSELAPALPRQIVLSAGGLIQDDFIIVGGTDDAANIAGFTNHAFAWNLKQHTLTPLPGYPGRPFGMAATAVLGGELFVFGGAHSVSNGVANSAESHVFSMATRQWRRLAPYPLPARGPSAVALDADRIYIAGGFGGAPEAFLSAAFIYDRRTSAYTAATPLPYAATAGLVMLDGFVYCIGGEDQMKSRTDAVYRARVKDLIQQP